MRPLRVIATVVAIAACSVVITSQTPSGHAVFEQALAKERVDGNLAEAIRLYERVVAEFPSDRALAARALLQVGLCNEKLSRQAGARATYERLMREYFDQAQIAGEAKTRLAALQRDATAPARQSVRDLPSLRGGLDSVSPDGTQALFTDYTKEGNVGIVDLTTGQSRLLTNFDGTAWAELGSWSPDGRHITYEEGSDTPGPPLRIVATLDGKTRTTYRWDATPSGTLFTSDWLPDGSAFVAANKRPDGRWAIGLAAIADGRFTPLRTLGWDFLNRTDQPRVSPDGRFVAFVERTSGLGDIHVLSIDGQHVFRITDHPADDRQPIWSPDGRQLAFLSNRFGSDALWTVTMVDGDAKGEAVKLKDGMNGVQLVDWRRRGLFYEQTEQSWDVFTTPMERGTTRSAGFPRLVPYTRSGWNLAPAWSPDGGSLAFVSGSLSTPNSRYVVVRPSSGAPREFAIPPSPYPLRGGPVDLRWFGNGRGLGFSAEDSKGEEVVWQLSLSSGEWTAIPRKGILWWTGIEWNDDGTAFYFARIWKAEGNGIFRRTVVSGREELLYATTPEAAIRSLEISPDRRWLAFEQWVEPKVGVAETQVIVLDLVSGERRTVVSPTPWYVTGGVPHRLRLSGWSPDGRVVVHHPPSEAGPSKWLLVPLDGGAAQPLSIDIAAAMGSASVAYPLVKWSPNGSSIVFVQHRGSGRLLVLENPLADLPAARIGATRR